MNGDEIHHAVAVSITSVPQHYDIWRSIAEEIPSEIMARMDGVGLSTQDYIAARYSSDPLTAADQIIAAAESGGMNIITYWDDRYPPLLKEIDRPPVALYVRGELPRSGCVAVVGTRRSDMSSSAAARRISAALVRNGYTVVSGMAMGVDREAHIGALEAGGATIGVLANGIDIGYPRSNKDLYHRIIASQGSALLSEYPPAILAGRWTFVRRNRIISGLSIGTVVVKAGKTSGALITARYALEQNREVFACPGHAFDESYAGCHELIQNGAFLVAHSDEIIKELSPFGIGLFREDENFSEDIHREPERAGGIDLVDDHIVTKILGLLGSGNIDIDDIVRSVREAPALINEALMSLELQGRIMRSGNSISLL